MPATFHLKSDDGDREFSYGQLVSIGRSNENDIALQDPKVSRSHAILRCLGDGRYYVMDTGSANGVFVNGKRVVVPFALSDSDKIRLGDHLLVFHEEPALNRTCANDRSDATPTVLSIGSKVQTLTILVVDIRDYTVMSEKISVDLLAVVLGRWVRCTSEIAEKNGGVIDHFIGDAVMMRWLTGKQEIHDSVAAALKTAYEMNRASSVLSKEFRALPHPLKIGVGINTGEAILGNVGATSRCDYTALGDSVNLAFRFESESKSLGTDVVIGPDSYKHLPNKVWERRLHSIKVKWKDKPVTVCALNFDQVGKIIDSAV